eukprot:3799758-Amphidinium_carterae.1
MLHVWAPWLLGYAVLEVEDRRALRDLNRDPWRRTNRFPVDPGSCRAVFGDLGVQGWASRAFKQQDLLLVLVV